MKTLIAFIVKCLLFVLMLDGCSRPEIDFIPGTYVKQFVQEYNEGCDTLAVTVVNPLDGSYAVSRHLNFTPIKNGKKLKPQLQIAQWFGMYNKNSKQLMIQPNGKVLTFSEEKQCLYIGNSIYNKLK